MTLTSEQNSMTIPPKLISDKEWVSRMDEEELEWMEANAKSWQELSSMVVRCTACGQRIATNMILGNARRHPILGVVVCQQCHDSCLTTSWSRSEAGLLDSCRWCCNRIDNSHRFYFCDNDRCKDSFCLQCLKANLSKDCYSKRRQKKWHCPRCKNEKIRTQRTLYYSIYQSRLWRASRTSMSIMLQSIKEKRLEMKLNKVRIQDYIKCPANDNFHCETTVLPSKESIVVLKDAHQEDDLAHAAQHTNTVAPGAYSHVSQEDTDAYEPKSDTCGSESRSEADAFVQGLLDTHQPVSSQANAVEDEPRDDTEENESISDTDPSESKVAASVSELKADTFAHQTHEIESKSSTKEPRVQTDANEPKSNAKSNESKGDTDTNESIANAESNEYKDDTDTNKSTTNAESNEPKGDTDTNESIANFAVPDVVLDKPISDTCAHTLTAATDASEQKPDSGANEPKVDVQLSPAQPDPCQDGTASPNWLLDDEPLIHILKRKRLRRGMPRAKLKETQDRKTQLKTDVETETKCSDEKMNMQEEDTENDDKIEPNFDDCERLCYLSEDDDEEEDYKSNPTLTSTIGHRKRRHDCDECSKTFLLNRSLTMHSQEAHLEPDSPNNPAKPEDSSRSCHTSGIFSFSDSTDGSLRSVQLKHKPFTSSSVKVSCGRSGRRFIVCSFGAKVFVLGKNGGKSLVGDESREKHRESNHSRFRKKEKKKKMKHRSPQPLSDEVIKVQASSNPVLETVSSPTEVANMKEDSALSPPTSKTVRSERKREKDRLNSQLPPGYCIKVDGRGRKMFFEVNERGIAVKRFLRIPQELEEFKHLLL